MRLEKMEGIKIKKHLDLSLSLPQPCDLIPVSPIGRSLPETGEPGWCIQ